MKRKRKTIYSLSEKAKSLIPAGQLAVTLENHVLTDAEIAVLNQLANSIPVLYETDGKEDALISLHYFYGGFDYYVLEWDEKDTFFGWLFQNHKYKEVGYQSKAELFKAIPLLNLDYYFKQQPIDEIL
jgi:hypothetical protein